MRLIIIREKTHRRNPQKRPTKETHKTDSSYHTQKWVMSAVCHTYICVCLNAASASHHHLRGYYIHCSCLYVNTSHHYLREYYMYVYMCTCVHITSPCVYVYIYHITIYMYMYTCIYITPLFAWIFYICIYMYMYIYITSPYIYHITIYVDTYIHHTTICEDVTNVYIHICIYI